MATICKTMYLGREKFIYERNKKQTGIRPNLASRSIKKGFVKPGKKGRKEMMDNDIRAENM